MHGNPSAPDPVEEAYDALLDPLVDMGGVPSRHTLPPSTVSAKEIIIK